jgi:phosphatidylinositol alpha-1,6-mannosyltransferase
VSPGAPHATILYVSPGMFDKGGISRYCRAQVRALRELVGDTAVVAMSLLPPTKLDFEEPFSVDLASMGPNLRGKVLLGLASALTAFQDRPALVWSAHAHLGPLLLPLARATRATAVQNAYGVEVWTDLTPARRFALSHMDAVLSDCHATRDYMVSKRLVPESNVEVHWDCVDVERFSPGDPGDVLARHGISSEPGAVTVMTLCRLSSGEKGIAGLFSMLRHIEDPRVRLVIAGGGSARAEFEKLAHEFGVAKRVFFAGFVSEADLAAMYRAADIFALVADKGPNRGEGLPLTPIEAAACGKPILVGNEDGSREALLEGVSGYALAPSDTEAFASRVRELAASPDKRARLGAAGRKYVVENMSYDLFRARLEGTLRRLAPQLLQA